MLNHLAKRLARKLLPPAPPQPAPPSAFERPSAVEQMQLRLQYQALAAAGGPLPAIGDVGFKAYSQTDEDGILLYLFALIGTTNKRAVEMCAADGIECNAANLIVNHGWHGYLFDGGSDNVARGRWYYRHHPATYVYPPVFRHSWITRDNVNELVRDAGAVGEIDLFSLDMDGVDYWIWEALDAANPRVVVLEYQDILGPDRALTVPYADDFRAAADAVSGGQINYCGASLPAFVKLGRRKGYRLVGVNRLGYNAFFVRNDLGERHLPEIDARTCFGHPKVVAGMAERYATVAALPWVDV